MKHLFFLIIFVVSNGYKVVLASDDIKKIPWSFGLNAYYGGLFKMRAHDPLLQFSHLKATEIIASYDFSGRKYWHQLYNYPALEFKLGYYDYGIPDVFGRSIASTGGLNFSLLQNRKNELRFSMGTGLVYSDKIYDKELNRGNRAISTHLSFGIIADLIYERNINNFWAINADLAFRHISNGRVKIPNNGLNAPMIGIGLKYTPDVTQKSIYTDTSFVSHRKTRFHLLFSRGWKNVMGYDPTLNHVNLLSVYMSHRLSLINSILVGMDGWYDTSTYHEWWLKNDERPSDSINLDNRKAAVTAGHIFYMGKFEFIFQFAHYIYLPHKFYSNVYQRYGIHYAFINNAFANVSLKAYRGKADLIEFGLGFSL